MTPDRPHGMTRYRHGPDERGNPGKGCRCTSCRAVANGYDDRRRRMVAYGRWDERVIDAAGTQRRIQALMRCGWSLAQLAVRLGCSRQEMRRKLNERSQVTAAGARAVAGLYDDLWDQPPPEGTPYEKRSVKLARRYAAERGFALPAAWDDDEIDDRAAVPVPGWERGDVRESGTLAGEVADLISFGLDRAQAAERLGVTKSTVDKTLARERERAAAGEGRDVAA